MPVESRGVRRKPPTGRQGRLPLPLAASGRQDLRVNTSASPGLPLGDLRFVALPGPPHGRCGLNPSWPGNRQTCTVLTRVPKRWTISWRTRGTVHNAQAAFQHRHLDRLE